MRVLNFNLKVWENIFQKAWKINTKQTYNYLFFFKDVNKPISVFIKST